jgi:hypothetical protein
LFGKLQDCDCKEKVNKADLKMKGWGHGGEVATTTQILPTYVLFLDASDELTVKAPATAETSKKSKKDKLSYD